MAKEKFVRLTRNVLRETFQECNEKYFEGTLPTPEIFELWTPSKYIAGWIRAIWINKEKRRGVAIHISKNLKWTKENLIDTMVHEMIHLEIGDYLERIPFWKRWFHLDHDIRFKNRMNELNEKFGLNVMVKSKHLRAYIIKPNKK